MKWMNLLPLVILGIAVGCQGKSKTGYSLTGHEWELKHMTQMDTVISLPEELPTLLFTDTNTMFGSAGCNRFFGTYKLGEKEEIALRTGGVTMMYCPDMPFEDRYLKALNAVEIYTVKEKELQLMDRSRKLILTYGLTDTTKRLGVAKDEHGCNSAAGYTWSEVKGDCIRLFAEGVQMSNVQDTLSSLVAYIVFSTDSLKAEVFVPDTEKSDVLERRNLPGGGYTWNEESDDTWNVRQQDGKWVMEKRGEIMYAETR